MDIKRIILENYDLYNINKIIPSKLGSSSAFIIETTTDKYIAKMNERKDFITVYDKVQEKLNKIGMIQSKIVRTNMKQIITGEGIVLYEYIDGISYREFNDIQMKKAIKYVAEYNRVLRTVSFSSNDLKMKNHWDYAKSIDYVLSKFPNKLKNYSLPTENRESIINAINMLSDNLERLLALRKQLIHTDLGSDNFILDENDEIISIIDFTPEYDSEYYSLGHFIYWNYLWRTADTNFDTIMEVKNIYEDVIKTRLDDNIFYILLIRVAIFRIVGPILELIEKRISYNNSLDKRFTILTNLLKIQ
ncbi:phosphotransferase [Alkaliphilus pronyensis]|nr:phosphotransferase [Alkaliphilus pronyensis]